MNHFYKNNQYFKQHPSSRCEYRNYNQIIDYGPNPFVTNIKEASKQNNTFRTVIWTGKYMQITLMNIGIQESIGLEIHPNLDQFIRIEQGIGLLQMGDYKNNLNFETKVYENFGFVIPAGKWHNLTNIGNTPIKLYSIYSPPQHPKGTIHYTKSDENH